MKQKQMFSLLSYHLTGTCLERGCWLSGGLMGWPRGQDLQHFNHKRQFNLHTLLEITELLENVHDVQPTVGELPVADVLQVRPGVLAHVLGGGDRTLLQLQFPSEDLGTLLGGNTTRHGASHGRRYSAVMPEPAAIQPGTCSPTVVLRPPPTSGTHNLRLDWVKSQYKPTGKWTLT